MLLKLTECRAVNIKTTKSIKIQMCIHKQKLLINGEYAYYENHEQLIYARALKS